jgi:hypothetical protein
VIDGAKSHIGQSLALYAIMDYIAQTVQSFILFKLFFGFTYG